MNEQQLERRGARLVDPIVLTLLLVSLGMNVFLALKVNSRGSDSIRQNRLAIGAVVKSITAADANGAPTTVRLDADDRGTVLFVYSPGCRWCGKTWPLFASIARARGKSFRFLALSVSEHGQLSPGGNDVQALSYPSRETSEQLKLGAVPSTVVFDRKGTVEQVWVGAYTGTTRSLISRYFSLPTAAMNSE